jgi:hypothetical protein
MLHIVGVGSMVPELEGVGGSARAAEQSAVLQELLRTLAPRVGARTRSGSGADSGVGAGARRVQAVSRGASIRMLQTAWDDDSGGGGGGHSAASLLRGDRGAAAAQTPEVPALDSFALSTLSSAHTRAGAGAATGAEGPGLRRGVGAQTLREGMARWKVRVAQLHNNTLTGGHGAGSGRRRSGPRERRAARSCAVWRAGRRRG